MEIGTRHLKTVANNLLEIGANARAFSLCWLERDQNRFFANISFGFASSAKVVIKIFKQR